MEADQAHFVFRGVYHPGLKNEHRLAQWARGPRNFMKKRGGAG
jgi:hypothetical protein